MDTANSTPAKGDVQVQVRFRTRQTQYAVTDTAILVPAKLRRYGLSEIINHLLDSTKPVPFNFLIDGKFLQTSLNSYLESNGLSTENVLDIEYVEATLPPTQAATYEHDEWISSVAGHPVAPLVLTGSYDSLSRVWDRSGNLKAVLKGHDGPVKSVAWIPLEEATGSKHRLLTGGQDFKLFGWEYTNDVEGATTRIAYNCVGHTGSVDAIAVHRSGSTFATASYDGSVLLWSTDPTDVEEVEEPRKRRKVQGDNAASIGSIPVKRAIKRLAGHVGAVSAVTYEKTTDVNATLYTGGWDHSVRGWDVESSSNTSTMNCEKVILDMDHSDISGLLVSGHTDNLIRLWDPRVKEGLVVKLKLASHSNWVSSVACSPTSAYAFASSSYDSTVKVWDIRSSTPLYTLSGGDAEKDEKVFAVDWVGKYIYSGGEDKQLRTFACEV
ncbi:WD40-repeat-containing domain protein [Powellomyces hirtus]|nr:WD40-repeat-containing domain protein [Powellomyces hirtus]